MFVSFQGIRCAGCQNAIEGPLRRRGAESVQIDPASRVAVIRFRGDAANAAGYCAAIENAGYRATLFAVLPERETSEEETVIE